jgi:hypothetical protein
MSKIVIRLPADTADELLLAAAIADCSLDELAAQYVAAGLAAAAQEPAFQAAVETVLAREDATLAALASAAQL